MTMKEWNPQVEEALSRAGWVADREVDISAWCSRLEETGIQLHDAFKAFIREFGGLAFDARGEGVDRAREQFQLDPTLAVGEEDRFSEWSELTGTSIVPIGELDHGRYFLGIDDLGKIYLVADWLAAFGVGPEGLERLILGRQPDVLYDSFPFESGNLTDEGDG